MPGQRWERLAMWMKRPFPTTRTERLMPKLRFEIPVKPMKVRGGHYSWRVDQGSTMQLREIAKSLNELIRDERIELTYYRAYEVRQYAERLIMEAMRNGDCHRPTMEAADFYLSEKELIHKLFKVLVPRYLNYSSAFTSMYLLPIDVRATLSHGGGRTKHYQRALIELKGNPFPPVISKVDGKNYLTNVLLKAARIEYNKEKHSSEPISEK